MFEINFKGATQHGGNGAAWATTGGTAANCPNFVNKRYFPRNISSIISNLEIDINQYYYIYKILNDYNCGWDATGKNRIGMNSDPSNKTTYNGGQFNRIAGYPVGCTSQSTDNSHLDQDIYTIRNWLGLLGGNKSTQTIDTSLYGSIVVEKTLDQAGILMLSPPLGTLTSYTSATNTEIN
jgi:hypothetical protein